MELFAIIDETIPTRIVRIDIDQAAQNGLNSIFDYQENQLLSNSKEIDFCPSYSVGNDEVFVISNFDDEIGVLNAINKPTAVPMWDPSVIPVHYFKALFSGRKGTPTTALIQAFDRRQVMSNEKSLIQGLFQSQNQFTLLGRPGFSLAEKLTCILLGDKLIFKSFFMLRRFFDMDSYFHEATIEDMESFLEKDIFQVENKDNFLNLADSAIKKKISLINNSEILNKYTILELEQCAQKLTSFELKTLDSNGHKKIIIPNNKKEIKQLLYFLEQGYFNSIITNEPMVTNSMRPLS